MFKTFLPVTIDHINYGGHLGHDKLLTLMHEARLRFFDSLGQSELDFFGISLILKSLTVNYRQEVFRGDHLSFILTINDVRGCSFLLSYQIYNHNNELVADANVELVGFDYGRRHIARLNDTCRKALSELPVLNEHQS